MLLMNMESYPSLATRGSEEEREGKRGEMRGREGDDRQDDKKRRREWLDGHEWEWVPQRNRGLGCTVTKVGPPNNLIIIKLIV